jgi:hypothetical protein
MPWAHRPKHAESAFEQEAGADLKTVLRTTYATLSDVLASLSRIILLY